MLDIKYIRENTEAVKSGIAAKGVVFDVDHVGTLDQRRRELLRQTEELKAKRNKVSSQIGQKINDKQDVSELKESMKKVSADIKNLDLKIAHIDQELSEKLLWIPNIPHPSSPRGHGATENVVVREWGEKKQYAFPLQMHWDLGKNLGLFDLDRGSKVTGSGFILYTGIGAQLQRALIAFMLDLHRKEHGYTEVSPPFVVNAASMTGTGQLPKMAEDMYTCEKDQLYLIPTAEVPISNIYQGEILRADQLPISLCAYTPCFRREAGSYGKDTRGLTRLHQFDKVELVTFVHPKDSYQELENLLRHAETVLQRLGLSYRVIELCTGDLSFAAAKCYDIEVWSPAQEKYLEVSSCSNFEDFQARRMGIRFHDSKTKKNVFVHTLNGSGLALPRTVIAILESYQQEDGSVNIPEVLQPYMDGRNIIS